MSLKRSASVADLVVAFGEDDAAEVAVRDVVDGFDEALERIADGGARRQRDEQRQQHREPDERPDDGAPRVEHGARQVVLVARQLHGGDDAIVFVVHRLEQRIDLPAVELDVLAERLLVHRHDLQAFGACRIERGGQVDVLIVVADRRALGAGDGAGGQLAVALDGGAGGDDEGGGLHALLDVGEVEVGEADVGLGVLPADDELARVVVEALGLGGVEGDAHRGADQLHLTLEVGDELGAARAQADPAVEAQGQEHERHRGERDACANLHRRRGLA